jgi:hypothetical protein
MTRRSAIVRIGCPTLLLMALGCGGGSATPKLAPVSGKVTVGGSEPFKKGLVRFVPKEVNSGLNMREATTDDHGNFVIMFNARTRGLEPGDYQVSFSLIQNEDGTPLSKPVGEDSEGVEFVPRDYCFGSTKNPITVPETGGTFDFDIPELKPQPKGKTMTTSRR